MENGEILFYFVVIPVLILIAMGYVHHLMAGSLNPPVLFTADCGCTVHKGGDIQECNRAKAHYKWRTEFSSSGEHHTEEHHRQQYQLHILHVRKQYKAHLES